MRSRRSNEEPLLLMLLLVLCSNACQGKNQENRIEVYINESAEFRCITNPNSTNINTSATVFWYEGDLEVDAWKNIPYNITGEMMTIPNVQISDEKHFRCEVYTPKVTYRTIFIVNVFDEFDPPIIEVERVLPWAESPSNIASCKASNGYPRANISWYRDEIQIHNVTNVSTIFSNVTTESSGLQTEQSFLLYKMTEKDKDAKFSCQVEYRVPGKELRKKIHSPAKTIPFHSLGEPVLIPNHLVMLKGESLTVECAALSTLNTSTVWLKEGVEVGSGPILYLENATFDTAGQYECVVTVDQKSTRGSGHVSVLDQTPVDWGMKEIIYAYVGDSVEIPCSYNFTTNPQRLMIYWSVATPGDARVWISYSNATVMHIFPNTKYTDRVRTQSFEGGEMLAIHNVQLSDEGQFHCNIMGDEIKQGEDTTFLKVHSVDLILIIASVILSTLLLTILVIILYEIGKLPCWRSERLEIMKEMDELDDIGLDVMAEESEQYVVLNDVNMEMNPPTEQEETLPNDTCESPGSVSEDEMM